MGKKTGWARDKAGMHRTMEDGRVVFAFKVQSEYFFDIFRPGVSYHEAIATYDTSTGEVWAMSSKRVGELITILQDPKYSLPREYAKIFDRITTKIRSGDYTMPPEENTEAEYEERDNRLKEFFQQRRARFGAGLSDGLSEGLAFTDDVD